MACRTCSGRSRGARRDTSAGARRALARSRAPSGLSHNGGAVTSALTPTWCLPTVRASPPGRVSLHFHEWWWAGALPAPRAGEYDPWRGGGVLESPNDGIVVIDIPGAAHHLDLMFSNPGDTSEVIVLRLRNIHSSTRPMAVPGCKRHGAVSGHRAPYSHRG